MQRILPLTALALAAAGTLSSAFAAPVTYQIDPTHTDVLVTWNHLGFSNPSAHFGDAEGSVVYDPANPSASSVEVTLPLTGMNSFTPKFDEHLRSAELFDVAKFPAATFKSTKVAAAGKDKLKVTGDLTVRGVTKPVVLDVTVNKVGEHPMAKVQAAGFDATTTFKRSDFGLGLAAPAVSDEVKVRITAEARAPKAPGAQ